MLTFTFEVFERNDVPSDDPQRFSVVGPTTGFLPLVPLSRSQAEHIASILNDVIDPQLANGSTTHP